MWLAAARELGAEVRELSPLFTEISTHNARTTIKGQTVMLNDYVSIALADDKAASSDVLASAGLAVPEQLLFSQDTREAALTFMEARAVPCVVKPARGSGGEGVTAEVRCKSDLCRAARVASRVDQRLVIERQIFGDVYRFLVLDGEIIDVLRQLPPFIVGDGICSVGDLILTEYDRRIRQSGASPLRPLMIDLDCLLTLRRAGLSLDSVLRTGQKIAVKTVCNFHSQDGIETVRGPIGRRLGQEVTRAAAGIGLRLAGVDVITTDLARGLAEAGGAIVDVNGRPGLHHHHQVARTGAASRVTTAVLSTLLREGQTRRLSVVTPPT
jgi:cyanophycin synthetase